MNTPCQHQKYSLVTERCVQEWSDYADEYLATVCCDTCGEIKYVSSNSPKYHCEHVWELIQEREVNKEAKHFECLLRCTACGDTKYKKNYTDVNWQGLFSNLIGFGGFCAIVWATYYAFSNWS